MKKTNITYWIVTGLMAAMLGLGSIFDAISAPEAIEHVTNLGYPSYIVPFLGVAKLLCIIAILIPGYPRVTEWAYAGLAYDIIGAIYSHISAGTPAAEWTPILIALLLIMASYFLHHKRLKLQSSEAQNLQMAQVQASA